MYPGNYPHLNDKGRFDYVRGVRADDDDYNILRHAGSIYSLLQYNEKRPSPEVDAAILRGSKYLRSRYIRPVKDHPELLAAFSRPDEEGVPEAAADDLRGADDTIAEALAEFVAGVS